MRFMPPTGIARTVRLPASRSGARLPGMRRAAMVCAAGLAFAASPVAIGSTSQPRLLVVTPESGLLMLSFTVGGRVPLDVQVASAPTTLASGAFAGSRVRLRERIGVAARTGVIHWRTRTALPAGTYYVHVSAAQTDGLTSCLHASNCVLRWSNVVRVKVP
jgi:hypothetical protein